jgi:hypothetical protein
MYGRVRFEAFHSGTEGDLNWKAVPLGDGTREEGLLSVGSSAARELVNVGWVLWVCLVKHRVSTVAST